MATAMQPVEAAAPTWPRRPSTILDWLARDARQSPDGAALLTALCTRLLAAGIPLARVSFHIRTLHPQQFALGFYWHRGADKIRVFQAKHGIKDTPLYQRSPMRVLFEGAGAVRQRLDLPDVDFAFPLFDELRADGLTDYVALPITFSDGKIHGTTWSSDRSGGFASEHLAEIEDLLPVFSLLLEIHLNRRIAINLLDTYVGHDAGEHILQGQITRGAGETVHAAIWFCDLRGFTALSERLERDALIECLNDYFDRMAAPVYRHGGEILKFIGDAMLAIFPLERADACERALRAATEARSAMIAFNQERRQQGDDALDFGIALHSGEVMYGNIGAIDRRDAAERGPEEPDRTRLDFTVVGPAVNAASRIESRCRELGVNVLLSDTFAQICPCRCRSLGTHQLAGIAREFELFTPVDAP